MTYTPPTRSAHSGAAVPLNDQDRERLTRMEQITEPTPGARGRLAAMRIRATTEDDQRRIRSLTDRWAKR